MTSIVDDFDSIATEMKRIEEEKNPKPKYDPLTNTYIDGNGQSVNIDTVLNLDPQPVYTTTVIWSPPQGQWVVRSDADN